MNVRLLIVCSIFISGVGRGEDLPRWSPENTYVLIVGVLDWQQSSLTTYAKMQRQDVALENQLLARGVPADQITRLLDRDATLKAIERELEDLARRAAPESTLMVYYAGHGMREGGQGVFANFDIDTRRALQTGWTHQSMSETISQHFHGKRVLLFADCCYSGTLEDVAAKLQTKGYAAACLTSASSSNLSTSNWTFTLTLIDLLKGQSLADQNQDDKIVLREAALEVAQSMRHFEDQRSGFALAGMSGDLVLAEASEHERMGSVQPPLRRGQYITVSSDGRDANARIVDADALTGRLVVRYRDYSQFRTALVDPGLVQPIDEQVGPRGLPVALPIELALRRASVDGKYRELLRSFSMPSEYETYGSFKEWGKWDGEQWGGQTDLPPGYWVYVYPKWYIWGETSVDPRRARLAELKAARQEVAERIGSLRIALENATRQEEQLKAEIIELDSELADPK